MEIANIFFQVTIFVLFFSISFPFLVSKFDNNLNYLDQLNIKYEIDHLLVRGLDYYSRTVFEIQSDLLGAQSALCGGGRYDYLIEELGGKSTPAIGFAAGFERLIIVLNKALNISNNGPDIYIVSMGSKSIEYAVKLAQKLRFKNNLIVHIINYL